MPRPRSLTTADLASAALAVLDRAGLSALTMRAVAQELGMATMALYRYVADRDALEILMVDQILETVDSALPTDADWTVRVRILLDRARTAIGAHPAAVPLVLRYRQSSPASMCWMEAMLSALTDAGFRGDDRVIAQRSAVAFLLGFLQNEHYASIAGAGTAALASATDFPLLAETAAQARTLSADAEFDGGVEILLRGLSGHPARKR
ncbi:TetR/AcrR family transcriptional regulator C-terminal domain-containing protein [Nocardia sp. NBC_01503]|uniref:TetR/AcrR family transcriptional regulator n=1 Tax=Nocardia sp. NBC_01503 TaxID=2975997 RepID=UPI002E7B5BFC|nr:TetR/AcrR family transcriptional regulator C-terminal domain-containing protein [Nocardia sp. NBC_01503]WTL30243.1 TetR/AcrR family transcriptional regulator C-terminal domain-containing protein [Nocardia sp. NBC_01503]